ncbi:hypothetical protein PIB30_006344 [Stylosanthes scabra]|uniref:Uncharacterized protein n=1 Tax=Stylosanthes scabra TaxID=79078 RepID=A0ABU6R6B4_9FABA|nr:hypothetical protein [Stylosanthes scabra]
MHKKGQVHYYTSITHGHYPRLGRLDEQPTAKPSSLSLSLSLSTLTLSLSATAPPSPAIFSATRPPFPTPLLPLESCSHSLCRCPTFAGQILRHQTVIPDAVTTVEVLERRDPTGLFAVEIVCV